MTTKSPEQEAEKVAREYVRSEWYESWPNTQGFAYDEICESEVEAHLAGQAVGEQRGYLRALEELRETFKFKTVISALELDGIISAFKSKGGL